MNTDQMTVLDFPVSEALKAKLLADIELYADIFSDWPVEFRVGATVVAIGPLSAAHRYLVLGSIRKLVQALYPMGATQIWVCGLDWQICDRQTILFHPDPEDSKRFWGLDVVR